MFQGARGSATESFARDGRELFHGNQILAGKVHGYDPATKFRQCDHTLANIFLGLERTFIKPEGAQRAKVMLADYLVLDAVIGVVLVDAPLQGCPAVANRRMLR